MAKTSVVAVKKPQSKPPAALARGSARDGGAPLSTRVADWIRVAIQEGEFQLGEALSELKLAAALGVSRTPVREALSMLQLQGLIEIRPQSGSFVFMPSEEDVGELCVFRRVIEVTALRLSFARRRDETLQQLRAALDLMERAHKTHDQLAMGRGDTAFHQAIAQNCGNVYLLNAYSLSSGRIAALRTHNHRAVGPLSNKAMAEHRAIVAAFAKGDLDHAEGILDEHVFRMRVHYLAARRRAAPEQGG